jgi:parallel beta-helix repeat protein
MKKRRTWHHATWNAGHFAPIILTGDPKPPTEAAAFLGERSVETKHLLVVRETPRRTNVNISTTSIRHQRPDRISLLVRSSVVLAVAFAFALAPHAARAAGTFYVDNSGLTAPCSNTGPGTEEQPFCTISAALTKVGGPGTTIFVKAGTYREQVTVPVSGASGDPLAIRTLGEVIIDGADTLTQASFWSQYSGDVWLTPIAWSPVQVILNGNLMTPSTDDPALLASSTFRYIAGEGLYVNGGGGNPGDQIIRVGHRLDGFHINGKSWVTIDGFTITSCDEKGIELEGGASNCEINDNYITTCASSGISLFGCADVVISNNHIMHNALHGIELRGGSTGCQIRNNESSWNMDRSLTVATGIYLNASPDNRLENNRVSHNGDTGIEIQGGSDNCISIQNVAAQNGDHGFQHLFAVGTVNVGNVAWSNRTDGFSIEGSSQNTSVFDCISVNNGLPVNGFDFYADTSSTAGMASDYNIFWNSTSQKPIKFRGVQYATVSAYSSASGLDSHTMQLDPMFFDPDNGLFHLLAGSPAIDSGTSGVANWPATDAQGLPREDDPDAPNTGAGAIVFADRGAFEHRVSTVGVGGSPAPASLSLSNGFPNPAQGAIAFALELPRLARVAWGVFDLSGRKLGGGSSWQPAGRSLVRWSEPKGSAAGVRFARFTIDGQSLQRRFVTVR